MNLPRKMFPALADNSYVYLNSGGSGPPSGDTIRAMRKADAPDPDGRNASAAVT